MERVAFLVEETGARIDCLLNPETLEVTRLAGIRQRGVHSGRLTGAGLADDPLHLTGGGRTELTVDLLFDIDLVTAPTVPDDVRSLTRPLWQLAENSATEQGAVRPPLVRFVWGKSWNVPGVVAAVAERFDRFGSTGVPQRSWLRMRFVRVADTAAEAQAQLDTMLMEARLAEAQAQQAAATLEPSGAMDPAATVVALGQGAQGTDPDGDPSPMRFDLLCQEGLGNPFLWRLLASYNDVADPLRVAPGTVLAVPPGLSGATSGLTEVGP